MGYSRYDDGVERYNSRFLVVGDRLSYDDRRKNPLNEGRDYLRKYESLYNKRSEYSKASDYASAFKKLRDSGLKNPGIPAVGKSGTIDDRIGRAA